MSKVENRLKELGIQLPTPNAPVANYVPYVVSGNLVFISGQVTMAPDGLKYVGKLGAEISLEDGKAAAKLCAVNLLAQLKAGLRRRSRPRAALRAAGRVRQRHAGLYPASRSGQWRVGFDRGGLGRCGQA